MIRVAFLLLLVVPAFAQEFPAAASGTLFDCTVGCGLMAHTGVQCWSFAQPATADHGPRCQGYCQYDGMPAYCPGPGWSACHTGRLVGLACNATEYVLPPLPGRTRLRMTCDGGSADGLVGACP